MIDSRYDKGGGADTPGRSGRGRRRPRVGKVRQIGRGATVNRRDFVKGTGLAATMLGFADVATARSVTWADSYGPSPKTPIYRMLVPEIFAPVPDPADNVPAIIIGS